MVLNIFSQYRSVLMGFSTLLILICHSIKYVGINNGSSGKWSDNVSIEQKKTAEHFVYLNNHKQIYKNEQQFSISCMGALQS